MPPVPGDTDAQVQEIGAALAGWTGPAVLAGDFNFEPDTDPYGVLQETWLDAAREAANEECTFGADLQPAERRKRIDFVWIRRERALGVLSAEVIEEPLASDHLPVLVVLEYAGTGR